MENVKDCKKLRTACVHLSVTEEEKKRIEAEADKIGSSVSSFLRYKLFFEKGAKSN